MEMISRPLMHAVNLISETDFQQIQGRQQIEYNQLIIGATKSRRSSRFDFVAFHNS